LGDRVHRLEAQAAEIPEEAAPSDALIAAVESDHVSSDDAPSAPAMDNASELDITAIAERYPLLRNTL
jgi:hypothetical protein